MSTQCLFSRFWSWGISLSIRAAFQQGTWEIPRVSKLHTVAVLMQSCPFLRALRLGRPNGVYRQSSFSLGPFSHPLHGDLIVRPVSYDFHFPYSKAMYLNILVEFPLIVRVMLPQWCLLFFQPVFLNEVLVKLPTDPSSDEPVFHISHIDRVYTLKTDNINERWVVKKQLWA